MRVLNAARQGQILSAPYFIGGKYRTSYGYCSRAELMHVIRLCPPNTRPLEVSAALCVTAQRAAEYPPHLPVQNSADIVGSIGGELNSAMVVGEM